jgi:hypothetical protein
MFPSALAAYRKHCQGGRLLHADLLTVFEPHEEWLALLKEEWGV